MSKIYLIFVADDAGTVVWSPYLKDGFYDGLGYRRLQDSWGERHAQIVEMFDAGQNSGFILPGGFIASAAIANQLVRSTRTDCELLPVVVEGKEWLLFNNLATLGDFDKNRSKVLSSYLGEIYWVESLFIPSQAVKWDLFTIAGSNRASIFVTARFVEEAKKLGVDGVHFREVGEITTP